MATRNKVNMFFRLCDSTSTTINEIFRSLIDESFLQGAKSNIFQFHKGVIGDTSVGLNYN